MGARARRSGRAKFTRPSPPNVVPSRENSAWFWLIGSSCPLHSAHPFGANPKLMILISLRNGSAILSSHFHIGGTVIGPGISEHPAFAPALPVLFSVSWVEHVALGAPVSTS